MAIGLVLVPARMGYAEPPHEPKLLLRLDGMEAQLAALTGEVEAKKAARAAAEAALARGDPPRAKVAMNDLRALVNQVEAQTDK